MNSITVNYEVVELMEYFWDSYKDKMKVADAFFIELAEKPALKTFYKEGFDEEAVRRVLSAVQNREPMNHPSPSEARFWSLNMWMLEDLGLMKDMLQEAKRLNLDHLVEKYPDARYEDVVVNFVPADDQTYVIEGNQLNVNFFKIFFDFMDPEKVKLGDMDFMEFFEEKIDELMS